MMQRFADAARKMNIGGAHQCFALFFFYGHDAFERVFCPFMFLMVVHQMHDFVAMRLEEVTLHVQKTGGIMVVDAMTDRAGFLMRICRGQQPLPASLMKYRTALRTDRRLRRLGTGFVGIVHALLKEIVLPGNFLEA